MITVSCLSQKGGVGKSTIARLIATTYAHAQYRVKIADFNVKQKTSVDWAAMRMEGEIKPHVAAEPFTTVKPVRLQQHNFDAMIYDGRPDSDTSTLEIARESDLIVIPVGTSVDDLQPQIRFAHELRSKGIDRGVILFVVNRTGDSKLAIDEAKGYVRAGGYNVAEADIPAKTGYEIAQNAGKAISETPYPTLNKRAEALAQEIVDKVEYLIKVPLR